MKWLSTRSAYLVIVPTFFAASIAMAWLPEGARLRVATVLLGLVLTRYVAMWLHQYASLFGDVQGRLEQHSGGRETAVVPVRVPPRRHQHNGFQPQADPHQDGRLRCTGVQPQSHLHQAGRVRPSANPTRLLASTSPGHVLAPATPPLFGTWGRAWGGLTPGCDRRGWTPAYGAVWRLGRNGSRPSDSTAASAARTRRGSMWLSSGLGGAMRRSHTLVPPSPQRWNGATGTGTGCGVGSFLVELGRIELPSVGRTPGLATTIPESAACGCRYAGSCGSEDPAAGSFSGVSGLCRLSAGLSLPSTTASGARLQRSGPACHCWSR